MSLFPDPGPCPICGAPHSACVDTPGPILVEQLPATAAAAPPLEAERVQATLPPGQFTTGTYRGTKSKKRP